AAAHTATKIKEANLSGIVRPKQLAQSLASERPVRAWARARRCVTLCQGTDRKRPGGPVLYRRDSHSSAGARGPRGLAIRGGMPGRALIAAESLSARCGCPPFAQAAAGACGPDRGT